MWSFEWITVIVWLVNAIHVAALGESSTVTKFTSDQIGINADECHAFHRKGIVQTMPEKLLEGTT